MTWCCDAFRSRIAREVAMDAKTPTIAATATAMSSQLVRGERLSFDCSVMKVHFKTPEGSRIILNGHLENVTLGCVAPSGGDVDGGEHERHHTVIASQARARRHRQPAARRRRGRRFAWAHLEKGQLRDRSHGLG